MERWQSFLKLDYADEILICVGVVMVIWSAMRIVSSSLKMLFWVVFAGIGMVSLSYGFEQSPLNLPGISKASFTSLTELATNTDSEVLKYICEKLNVTGN